MTSPEHLKCVKPSPEIEKAIMSMPKTADVAAVRRFLGTVQYLSKFVPSLSDIAEPLRILVHKDVDWHWNNEQENA